MNVIGSSCFLLQCFELKNTFLQGNKKIQKRNNFFMHNTDSIKSSANKKHSFSSGLNWTSFFLIISFLSISWFLFGRIDTSSSQSTSSAASSYDDISSTLSSSDEKKDEQKRTNHNNRGTSPSPGVLIHEEEKQKSILCPEPFFYPRDVPAGISNQREHWLNHLLLAEFFGFKTVVIPSSCPLGYVQFQTNKKKKQPPPFDTITPVIPCGNYSLLMDVGKFKRIAEKMGLCVVDPFGGELEEVYFKKKFDLSSLNNENNISSSVLKQLQQQESSSSSSEFFIRKSSIHFENLPLRDWQSNPRWNERLRYAYKPDGKEIIGIRKQVEEMKRKFFSEKRPHSAQLVQSWFAVRPTVALTTVFYTRFYDRCDDFCACPEILRSGLRPSKLIQGIVDNLLKVIRGELPRDAFEFQEGVGLVRKQDEETQNIVKKFRDEKEKFGLANSPEKIITLHFRVFRCNLAQTHIMRNLREEILWQPGVSGRSPSVGNSSSSSTTETDTDASLKIISTDESKMKIYVLSEFNMSSEKNFWAAPLRESFEFIQKETLYPDLFDLPFEVRSLIDYEIALRSDVFFGFPGGSSFTHFIFTERRNELLRRVVASSNQQEKKKSENSAAGVMKFPVKTYSDNVDDDDDETRMIFTPQKSFSSRQEALDVFSKTNIMLQSFKPACPKQSSKTPWEGVPVEKYVAENEMKKSCLWDGDWRNI